MINAQIKDRFITLRNLISRSRTIFLGAALFAFFFVLYGFTHDRVYAFDSLLSALSIRRPLFAGPIFTVLSWNHFLWLPVLRWFFIGLKSAGLTTDPYSAIQWWNTFVGAVLVVITYGFLLRFIHRTWALLISFAVGFCHLIWLRATSGDPYLTGTLFSILTCCLLTIRSSRHENPLLFLTALTCVMAAYMHIANLAVLPVVLLVIIGKRDPDAVLKAMFVLLASAVMLLPYILFYDLTTFHGLKEWLTWGSGQVNGQAPGMSSTGQFDLRIFNSIPVLFSTLLHGIAAVPVNGSVRQIVITALSVSALIWCAIDRARQKNDWPVIFPPLAFFAGITLVFSLWMPGNLFYWASPVIFFILSVTLLFSERLQKAPGLPSALLSGFLIVSLGFVNFQRVIRPNMNENAVKPLVDLCGAIEKATPPGSVILISGHYAGFLKVGIPYFAQRQTLALELIAIQYYGTGQDPLAVLQALLNDYLKKGIPVYMLDDVLAARGEFGPWGLSPERIDSFLHSYRLKQAARLSDSGPGILYRME